MSVIEITKWAKSAEGRDIALFKSEENPQQPILLIGGVHGDEPEGVQLAQDTLAWLKSNSGNKTTPWVLIPCLNPDGLAKNERTNGKGVDLNRNYPSRDWTPEASKPRYNPGPSPGSESEIKALVALIQTIKPRLIIHCHSWEPCIVYTGEPGRHDALALGKSSGYEPRDDIGYPTTGSLSRYAWHDHHIPVICIEEAEHTPLAQIWSHFEKSIIEIFTNHSKRDETGPCFILKEAIPAQHWNIETPYSVIAIPFASNEQTPQLLKKIQKSHPDAEKLISCPGITGENLKNIFSSESEHLQICNFSDPNFEAQLELAQARYQKRMANILANEKKILDTPIKSRSQKRTVTIKTQVEALHKALLAVHSSQSVAEVETLLYSALAEALDLDWVRVFLHASEHLDNQLERIQGQALFKATLVLGSRQLGRIVFARAHAKAFSKSEEESLNQITESVALALDRLAKLDQAETLKFQWDSTFDAISEPLCLTDEKFNILRTNQAFLKTTGLKLAQAIGSNCFSAFSGRTTPAQLEPTPNAFILQRAKKSKKELSSFEVTTQRIHIGARSESILLVMFRDITEQKKIEKQIFESSKMAELGTIGSSIAHDINNPLGGMLSFLQLIKMDMKPDHPIHEDILEMERAGMRCKEIVENLLRFSRRQETGQAESVNLREVIDQSLKISELQTRSLGIEVEINSPENHHEITGHFNLLSQALSHILQNSFDAVSEKLSRKPGFKGLIKIDIASTSEGQTLTIFDNGIGISPELQSKILNPLFSTKTSKRNPGLGLTLAYQIISDHKGRLEISSQPNVGTKVIISFANV